MGADWSKLIGLQVNTREDDIFSDLASKFTTKVKLNNVKIK